MEQDNHDQNVARLASLIKDFKVAMLTTIEPGGQLRSRPMATQKTEFDGQLWFFTELDSAKVDEIDREQQVGVSYANPDQQIYVSVSGTARVVRDRARIEELWSPLYKAFFPKGLDDPNIALLRVDAEQAEYWDSPSGKLVQLAGFVKAIATGKQYGEEGSDHKTIKL